MIGPTSRKNLLTFGDDPFQDTDSRPLFHRSHHSGIGILRDLLAFPIQSPVDFHETSQVNESTTFRILGSASIRKSGFKSWIGVR